MVPEHLCSLLSGVVLILLVLFNLGFRSVSERALRVLFRFLIFIVGNGPVAPPGSMGGVCEVEASGAIEVWGRGVRDDSGPWCRGLKG